MDLRLQSITITMLSWGLIQNISEENDRARVRFIDVDLTHGDKEYINAINFFIENDLIEVTDDENIYIPTEWFYDAAKEYLKKFN